MIASRVPAIWEPAGVGALILIAVITEGKRAPVRQFFRQPFRQPASAPR
jgi:hypothetical protein